MEARRWATRAAPASHRARRSCRALAALREQLDAPDWIVYEVTLDWRPHAESPPLRERIFSVIGSFTESSTHVAQRTDDDAVEYDVVTGMLPDQTEFRTHGHLVRFRFVGEPAPFG